MGGKEGDTFNLCTMTKGSILSMSSWLQANTSPIISKKSCEHLADRGISEGSNFGHSVKFGVVKKYHFKILNGLHRHLVFFYVHGLEVVIHFHHGHVAFVCGHLISM